MRRRGQKASGALLTSVTYVGMGTGIYVLDALSTNTSDVTFHASSQAGDLALLFTSYGEDGNNASTLTMQEQRPTGWLTAQYTYIASNVNVTSGIFYKILDASDISTGSVNCEMCASNGSRDWKGMVVPSVIDIDWPVIT